jgi:hypothetical protein
MNNDETPMKIKEYWGPFVLGERDDLGRGLVRHSHGESYAIINGEQYPKGSPEYIDVMVRIKMLNLGWKPATKDISVCRVPPGPGSL